MVLRPEKCKFCGGRNMLKRGTHVSPLFKKSVKRYICKDCKRYEPFKVIMHSEDPCPNCGVHRLIKNGTRAIDRPPYRIKRYKCRHCDKNFTDELPPKPYKPCPYCKEKRLMKRGFYYLKTKPHKVQVYYCGACKRSSHFKGATRYITRWSGKLNKFVMRHVKKTNCTSYQIAQEVKEKFKMNVGPSTVDKLIKNIEL